jgi:hypothetical protein
MRARQFVIVSTGLALVLAGVSVNTPTWAQNPGQPEKHNKSAPPSKASDSGAGSRGTALGPSTEPNSPAKVTTPESGAGPRGTPVAPSTEQGQLKK